MNLQLHNVVSDITGVTGMRIIKAIDGERDPEALASMRDPRCKNTQSTIARSFKGNYRPEHLFSLQQAVELYEFYQTKIADCDRRILDQLKSFDDHDEPPDSVEDALIRMSGVDLTTIDGIDPPRPSRSWPRSVRICVAGSHRSILPHGWVWLPPPK